MLLTATTTSSALKWTSELLEQAFRETYGLELKTVLPDEDKALGSYRRAVSKLIPKATRIGWSLKKDEIQHDQPSMTKRKFLYTLKRAHYEHEWGNNYLKPTLWERFLAVLYKILPKFGPLRVLQLKTPTPQTEHMFERSFNDAFDSYKELLAQSRNGGPNIPNDNFDTGSYTPAGKYSMNDDVRAELMEALAKQNFAGVSPELRSDLLNFYADPHAEYATRRKPKEWAKLQQDLQQLKSTPGLQAAAGSNPASTSSATTQ